MHDEVLTYRFDDFVLDVANRQLRQGTTRLDLNGRYLDALVLLVRKHGQLVEKEQFFNEVWGDVVVSDAALTQCIKDIRKQLGESASNPRYIETVPRYGYRFIGKVSAVSVVEADSASQPLKDVADPKTASASPAPEPQTKQPLFAAWHGNQRMVLVLGSVGTLGGGLAGILGGLLYGFGLAYAQTDPQLGTASLLLVLITLNVIVGTIGGCGISFGIAATGLAKRSHPVLLIASATFGGMLVGGLTKLLGVDAFTLLFGQAPAGITGGLEGAALGMALAIGAQVGGGLDAAKHWHPIISAGIAGTIAGMLIPLAGGRLMGGSLELLAHAFASSRLQLDALGRFFGELHFGTTTQMMLGGIEGLLFGSCVIGAIVLARRA